MVEYGGGTAASKFAYPFDALHRRVKEDQQDVTDPVVSIGYRDLYYSDRWQVVAEYFYGEDSTNVITEQTVANVWSSGYVDELVQRSRTTTVDGTPTSDTVYVQQDANFNVTSVTDTSGTVQERYQYDPYGKQVYLDASWGSRASSSYGMVYLHQGGRYNVINKLYSFRFRDYSADLGRWMQMDPAGYIDGSSLYQAHVSSPVSWLDPSGLGIIKNTVTPEEPKKGLYEGGKPFEPKKPDPAARPGDVFGPNPLDPDILPPPPKDLFEPDPNVDPKVDPVILPPPRPLPNVIPPHWPPPRQ